MSGHLAHGPANRGRRVLETAAPLFVCEPAGEPRGGAVLVHGLLGLTHDVEAACRELAAHGWLAVAPFLYHGHGGPAFGPGPEEESRARVELAGLSRDDLDADVSAAVAYLANRGCLDVAVVGLGTGTGGFPPLESFAGGRGVPLLETGPVPLEAALWRRVEEITA